MDDSNNQRQKVNFNDRELISDNNNMNNTGTGSLNRDLNTKNRHDLRTKNVNSLLRRRNQGYKVSNSLSNNNSSGTSSGALISPPKRKPTRILIHDPAGNRYNNTSSDNNSTSRLLLDIDNEVQDTVEMDVKRVSILNQVGLKPIDPLWKCCLMVRHNMRASVMSKNKFIETFEIDLRKDVKAIYFRKEENSLQGEFILLLKSKRQLLERDLNLLNSRIVPTAQLPKFDKLWLNVHKSLDFSKFHSMISHLDLKIYHLPLNELNAFFLTTTTSPEAFYGTTTTSSLLNARRMRSGHTISSDSNSSSIEKDDLIKVTPPRTRSSSTRHAADIGKDLSRQMITIFDDQHENLNQDDQIYYTPALDYKFEDKRTFTITNSDFKCLYNNNWINDNLIDFFLKLNLENTVRYHESLKDQILLLNSFFFPTLLKTNENYYENVKNWFKDGKLFNYKYLIIPVNQDLHWYCLIIHNLDQFITPSAQAQAPASEPSQSEHEPPRKIEIFVLDSLNQDHKSIRDPLIQYLSAYAKEKYELELTEDSFKMFNSPIPKQTNFNDCGIHVIYNIDIFLNKMDDFKEMWRKTRHKFKNKNRLFRISERQHLRVKLRKILIEELRKQEQIKGNPEWETVGKLTNKEHNKLKKAQKSNTSNAISRRSSNGGMEEDADVDADDDSDFEIIENNDTPGPGPEVSPSTGSDQETHLPPTDSQQQQPETEFEPSQSSSDETNKDVKEPRDVIKTPTKKQISPTPTLEEDAEDTEDDIALAHRNGNDNANSNTGEPSFEDFYEALQTGPSNAKLGELGDFAETQHAWIMIKRLICYLRRYESLVNISSEAILTQAFKSMISYFNSLDDKVLPELKLMKDFYDQVFVDDEEEDEEEEADHAQAEEAGAGQVGQKQEEDIEIEDKSINAGTDIKMIYDIKPDQGRSVMNISDDEEEEEDTPLKEIKKANAKSQGSDDGDGDGDGVEIIAERYDTTTNTNTDVDEIEDGEEEDVEEHDGDITMRAMSPKSILSSLPKASPLSKNRNKKQLKQYKKQKTR